MVDHIGKRVKGLWILDGVPAWYKGTIVNFAFDKNLHTVIFDDGDESNYNLDKSLKKCTLAWEDDAEENSTNTQSSVETDENKGVPNTETLQYKRPRGRPPKNKLWSAHTGSWEDEKDDDKVTREIKKAKKLPLSQVNTCKKSIHGRKLSQVKKLDWCSNIGLSYDDPDMQHNKSPTSEMILVAKVVSSDDEPEEANKSETSCENEVDAAAAKPSLFIPAMGPITPDSEKRKELENKFGELLHNPGILLDKILQREDCARIIRKLLFNLRKYSHVAVQFNTGLIDEDELIEYKSDDFMTPKELTEKMQKKKQREDWHILSTTAE